MKVGRSSGGNRSDLGAVAAENRTRCAGSFHSHLYNGRSGSSADFGVEKRERGWGASAHIYKLSLPTSLGMNACEAFEADTLFRCSPRPLPDNFQGVRKRERERERAL